MHIPSGVFAVPVTTGCIVLLWSGLEKVRNSSALAETISELGIPSRISGTSARLVAVTELATVAAMVAGVPSVVPSLLFIVLGSGFAATAAWSLLTGRKVSCACFGSSHGRLGWPQVAAYPMWLVTGWATVRLPGSTFRERIAALVCAMLVLTALRAIPAIRRAGELRTIRRALAGG